MSERVSDTDSNLILLDGVDAYRKHLLNLLANARRDIFILSDNLDSALFDDHDFVEALSAFVRSDRVANAKILVKESQAITEGHPGLRNLFRRISTKLSIRQLRYEPENNDRSYVVGDNELLLYIHDSSVYNGFVNYKAGPELTSIREEFIYLWEQHGCMIPELRELYL